MTVTIVIPHWNRCQLLERLLQSIAAQRLPAGVDLEVLVVDNGSTDPSGEVAEKAGARVLQLGRNRGVSYALNQGIMAAKGEWIALLNNDIELSPEWLQHLVEALRQGDAWFATGKTLDAQDRSRVDGAGDAICRGGTAWRLGHGKEDGPLFAAPRQTYFPSATATLFRRAFFDRLGLLEERFFAYLEDIDLGLRAAIEDLPGCYVPRAVAYHRGSETLGAWSRQTVEWLTCHQLLLLAKFYPTRLLLRYFRPIVTAQLLWATLAISRGRTLAWGRGVGQGLWRFAEIRRLGSAQAARTDRLAAVLRSAEAEIARFQGATSWDTYWKWYFRLAWPSAEKGA